VEAEALRVWCAVPHMGAELTEDMIPAEAGNWLIESTVSFTKGCYVGQELIARVDSRGNNTPRHMVQLRANEPLVLGELTAADGGVVGSVTSVAAVDGQWLALGFLARSAAETDVLSDANGVATEVVLTPGR
jgi:folate-binding protein YgfZ